jgi:8-oxo-dGTP pyrophosphatase MutT (NUDIX family)
MRTINREIVSALLFSKDNKIFMGKKDPTKGGVYSDCWHIPGGGIEESEDKIQALVREIQEETGIDITSEKIELADDRGEGDSEKTLPTGEKVIAHMHFNVYKVQLNKNAEDITVTLKDDLVEYKWVALEEILVLKLTPPSRALFQRLSYI